MISYIVSAYNRPLMLACCLYSLLSQTSQDFEVFVMDNSEEGASEEIWRKINNDKIRYFNCKLGNCYESANLAAQVVKGDYLCFPSEDSYYMPIFGEVMEGYAIENKLDLVYCNMVYDRRHTGIYETMDVNPRINEIDKTGFIVKKEKFTGFDLSDIVLSDGKLIESLVEQGISHDKLLDTLVVHN